MAPAASAAPEMQAPPAPAPAPPPPKTGDATGGIIPYKNPAALLSYYLGVFSLIPGIGLLLSLGAIAFGVLGLQAAAREPVLRGKVHAWIGLVLGCAVLVAHIGLIAFLALR
jgi:hypothetical protein